MGDSGDETSPLLKQEENEYEGSGERATRKITRFITVEPILILYFMAYAPSIPLYEQYVYKQILERHNFSIVKNDSSVCYIDINSTEYKQEQLVQSESSVWLIYFAIASIVPTTLMIVFIGPYTDETGRKLAMYLPLVGAIGKLTTTAIVVGLRLPFEVILVGCVFDGLSGSIVALAMTCFAYIADVSTVKQRALRIFILEISIGIGVVLSNVTIGYAIKLLGYFYPFVFLLVFHVLNLFYTYFAVQESIIKRDNVKFLTTVHIRKTFVLYTQDDGTNRKWKINILMLAMLFISCIDLGNSDIQTYKLLKSPLCFTSVLVGYFIAVNYAVKMTLGAAFLKFTYRYLKEIWTMILSCMSSAAFNFVFPFATTELFAFLCKFVAEL